MLRAGHASVIIDQYLVIIGGIWPSSRGQDANLIVFDLQKETCFQVEISGRRPGSISGHSACYWKDNQIIVYGGENGLNDEVLSEVGIITLSFTERSLKAEWRMVETNSKIRSRGHAAHIYQNQMIVVGGTGAGDIPLAVAIRILNLDDFTWMQPNISGEPPSGDLALHGSVLYGNDIYVSEAKSLGNWKMGRGFSSLNLETYTWKKLPEPSVTPGSSSHFAAIQEHQGKIYFVEQFYFSSQTTMILKSFDINQGKWTSGFQLKQQGLLGQGLAFSLDVYDNQLVVYGGVNTSKGQVSNELWFFRLGDSEISPKSTIQKKTKDGMVQENIMKKFLREAPYSDVIFEVESEKIPAHKWWLCNKSKYFANMFSSGMIEAKSSKIIISDMSAPTFRAFLEYLYSDDVELDVTLAKDLLTQADKYSVPELKGLCEQFLLNNIEPNNYVLLANLSELLEANKLRDAVKDYIAKSIKMLKARKDFEEISMDMLRDVLIKVTVK